MFLQNLMTKSNTASEAAHENAQKTPTNLSRFR
jgi:hypothetical protein